MTKGIFKANAQAHAMQAHDVVGFTPQGQTCSGGTDPTFNSPWLTMPHGIQ